MRKPDRGQLTAVKTGHVQTTITKLITWARFIETSYCSVLHETRQFGTGQFLVPIFEQGTSKE